MTERQIEESRGRLEGLRTSMAKATAAVGGGKVDALLKLGLSGLPLDPVAAARGVEAGAAALESVGVDAPALEAIVRLVGRPPLVVRNDAVVIEPDLLVEFPAGIDGKIRLAEASIPSVGRVEFVNHDMSWGGTGWVVQKTGREALVFTNRHVAKLVAKRAADGRGVFLRSPFTGARYGANVDFNEEVEALAGQSRTAKAIAVEYVADDASADAALLRIVHPDGAAWALPDALPLAESEAEVGELVALIGYPAFDTRNDQTAMERYFRGLYDVKRFAPGIVSQAAGAGSVLSHDCTSLGGNSGSCLISLESQSVVGLHFAGQYGIGNSAVSVATLRRLRDGQRTTVAGAVLQEVHSEARDGFHKPEELAGRNGYDPDFLGEGLSAPWPAMEASIAAGLATPSDATAQRPKELRYTHFGVLFSEALMLPAATAVNIDGKRAVRVKRGDDKWFVDGRINPDAQYTSKHYADQQIDRGHMVRREDPNWAADSGPAPPEALRANLDTFHYTNSAPQHSTLNQGKTLWQGLENYILDSARTHGFRACVFTGPVLNGEYEYLAEEGDVRVPLEFWKVVVMTVEDGGRQRLHATAYLLSQGQLIRKLLEDRDRSEAMEGFRLGAYRTFQLAIADLEAATGMDFHKLRDADPLAKTTAGAEALDSKVPLFVPLETPEDLVL